ncbi:restriction endonuclease subunit S, partial [uncultured Duncaniella sp.]|uniref:restriction endonuclease subunit S n=1 Tax=uncultured Duncaniella sp. TaxID=2768039 RepID=UPI0026340030
MLSLSIYRKWTSTNLQLGGISCSANSYYEKNIATGSVRCIDDEIPFDIPQGWEWCRFRSICKQLTDGTHNTPHYVDEGVPFISVKDMSSGRISFSNTRYISFEEHEILSARCNPEKGDLLLSKVGTTGIPALISDNRPFSIFVSLALIKFFNDEIETDYLIHLINSPLVQEQAKTNTRGVGNKNWVLSAISNTLIVIPPKNQQISIIEFLKGIESKLNSCDKLIENFERLNSKIKDKLSQSILQEAIQGSLVPQIESEGTAEDLLAEIRAEKQRLVKEGKLKKSVLVNESRIFRGDDNKYYEQIG